MKLCFSNSPTCLVPKILLGAGSSRQRGNADTNFADTEVEELVAMLRETESLEEQGDILQYLVDNQGLDFNTGMYPYCSHSVQYF